MKVKKDSKLLLKIFSAFIAVVLWFAITYTEDPAVNQYLGDINTVFSGEAQLRERGLTVVNKDDIPAISAVIRGNRSKVISSLGVVTAAIDVSNITDAGTHDVPVEYRYPAESVMLTKTKVSTVSVTVEKILSRDIPVKVTTEAGKDIEHIIASKSDTEVVTVRGAQSTVEKIAYAMVTVDADEVSVSGNMDYIYKLYDKDGNIISQENIISKNKNTISVTNTIYNKADLPVEVILADSLKTSYALNIKKQSLSHLTVGLGADIKYETLPTLHAVLDEEAIKEEGTVTLDIEIPEGMYSPENKPTVTVEFELLPKTEHEIEVNVTADNVPEGKKVTFNPEKIKISVKCAKNDASPNKISATIDAKELKNGENKNVTVKITAEENIEVSGSYTVTATLH